MSFFGELARRLSMLFRRSQFDADLEEEMRLHLELREQQQLQTGMTPTAAHSTALRRFGNPTVLKGKSHTTWGWQWFEDLLHDLSYGMRSMLRSPGITLVALLSLALGIGANTAIFSLMDAVMLRSLPVTQPEQLVLFGNGTDSGISDSFSNEDLFSYPFYRAMQQKNQIFSDLAAVFSMNHRIHGFVEGRSEAEPMNIQLVSGTYFPMLGVRAMIGRILTDDDDRMKDGNPVAIVSYSWWNRNMEHDASVLDKKLKIGSTIFTIVGVAPPEFFGTKVGDSPDIWIPLSMQKEVPPNFDGYTDNFSESLYLMGRLKPGTTTTQAATNVNLLFRQILLGFPDAPIN
jgi:hypothetical protein